MREEIIKDLMQVVHDTAKIKGENEALRNENKFLRELLTKQLNILPVGDSLCPDCNGKGFTIPSDRVPYDCEKCSGTGKLKNESQP